MSPDQREGPYRRGGRRGLDNMLWALVAACAVLLAAGALHPEEAHSGAGGLFGFYGWYGFLCCVGLALAARGLRRGVAREEDYYGRD